MSSTIPPSFIDLNTACTRLNHEVSVVGVVTDFLPPTRSRGTDWMCSFSLIDPSYNGINDEGLKVRFFKPMEIEMPAIRGIGDVVQLRSLKINNYKGMTCGISSRATSWTVFPAASIPAKSPASSNQVAHVKDPRAPTPTLLEVQYAFSIYNSRGSSVPSVPMSSVTINQSALDSRAFRDKFSLIKDLASDNYYDLVGQVVKTYAHNDRVELYLTDYTSNNLLFHYEWGQDNGEGSVREGDAYNYIARDSQNKQWPGPFGKMALTVTLWPPHAYFGRQNLKDNDFIHLRNVHIKFSKDAKLEGVLHSDRRYPDRIDVTILKNNEDDDRVKDVLRRKRDYAKTFQKSSADFVNEARGLKRKEMEETKPLSKTAQRKKRKQAKAQLTNAKSHVNNEGKDQRNNTDNGGEPQPSSSASLFKSQKQELNKNVNCANHLVPPRSLSSIISLDKHQITTPEGNSYTLPFQNIKSRATVRVVDFFPSELVDFAVPCPKPSEFDILSDPGDSESEREIDIQSCDAVSGSEEDRRWEWRFGLVLEDAMGRKSEEKAKMEVYVARQDAECLLKLDAVNLRKSPLALANLQEKLFLLWGDLEERQTRKATALKEVDGNLNSSAKEELPKCKPFQCCLKEYGIKAKVQHRIAKDQEKSDDDGKNEKEEWIWERRWRMFGTTIV